jgi:extracellular factor (EF) 3-hydroxypalmitic acid methyl ester biosynthesis protein
MQATTTAVTESFVSFHANQGVEIHATLLQLSRFQVVFEVYSPASALRISEALSEFRIVTGSHTIYSGRAILSSMVVASTVTVCEAKLEDSWLDLETFVPTLTGASLRAGFDSFLTQWHRVYRILPEFKGVIADMQTFLTDLRLWLDQVELSIRSTPAGDRLKLERDLGRELGPSTTRAIGELFEKFESVAARLENESADERAAHSAFAKRLLHPLLLCSPFLYRTFRKPLGYAGDYEMVNMICREPLEGGSLFAKIVNLWFLRQPPAEAHRNRIQFLFERLQEAVLTASRANRLARIVSVGCGPAVEVQRFLAESPLANRAHFTLIDFNEETIQHVRSTLEAVRQRHLPGTSIQIVKKSVNQILKEAGRTVSQGATDRYDLVYCAGLFDYLSNPICRRLSSVLYEWVAPGGVLLTTNVDSSNPRRLTMDYIMDWHLIYRSGSELATLKPDQVNGEQETSVASDITGVNVHYMVRKGEHG